MDINTWNSLSASERDEVDEMRSDFIKMVLKSNASDGFDFMNKYHVGMYKNFYYIFEKQTKKKFGSFRSRSKAVMDALFTDAVQNYGR